MNKERYNQIIDEAYENYHQTTLFRSDPTYLKPIPCFNTKTGKETIGARQYMKEEFINNCKTDSEFSEKWGLKIEERELSEKERMNTLVQNEQRLIYEEVQSFKNVRKKKIKDCLDERNVPTKLITLTYNNETIEMFY